MQKNNPGQVIIVRRRKGHGHGHHGGSWKVALADFMTAMMAFFLLMWLVEAATPKELKAIAGYFQGQDMNKYVIGPGGSDSSVIEMNSPIPPERSASEDEGSGRMGKGGEEDGGVGGIDTEEAASRKRIEELVAKTRADATDLAKELQEQIARGEVEVETQSRKIIVRIREKGSFASGSASLAEEYSGVLQKVRNVLAGKPGQIMVQGHTDDVPIATARFRSNWELSTARAISVAHELLSDGVLDPHRFAVTGFGETHPLVANESAENRAQNRRVEILIQQGLDKEAKKDLRVLREKNPAFYKSLKLEPNETEFDLQPSEVF